MGTIYTIYKMKYSLYLFHKDLYQHESRIWWYLDLQLEIKYKHVETLLCKLILSCFLLHSLNSNKIVAWKLKAKCYFLTCSVRMKRKPVPCRRRSHYFFICEVLNGTDLGLNSAFIKTNGALILVST